MTPLKYLIYFPSPFPIFDCVGWDQMLSVMFIISIIWVSQSVSHVYL